MPNIYDTIFKPKVITLKSGHSVTQKASRTPVIVIAIIAVSILAGKVTGFSISVLFNKGYQFLFILKELLNPDFTYAPNVWTPLISTIQMTVIGAFIGCVLALPYSVISSSNIIKNKVVISVLRFILSIIRTLPTLIMALIATMIFGLGTFAGTVSIALFNFGIVSKMMYEHIETVDMGAYEAMEALGSTKVRAFISSIFPQVLPIYLSTCLYCIETTIRHAAVLGYVGAGGIGKIINERISWREYRQLGMILLTLFATVVIIENLSQLLRRKLS